MDKKRKYNRARVEVHNQMRMQQIGGLLREYRFSTMLSREDFSAEYGISRSLLERIENGQNVQIHSLLRVIDAHMIPVETIFMGVG